MKHNIKINYYQYITYDEFEFVLTVSSDGVELYDWEIRWRKP